MNLDAEWLETDGHGGFASGTVGGARSRRYHALLLPATRPPVGRMVLVNGLEVWLTTPAGRFPLSTQCYPGGADGQDVLSPRGQDFLVDFRADPWPGWTYQFPDGTRIDQEIFIHQSTGLTALGWRLPIPAACTLEVRLLFSGRDYHSLHHENDSFAFAPVSQENNGGNVLWQPYPGVPGVRVWSSGTYRHEPSWYRRFLYPWERARGLDDLEDLAVPGVFMCDLARNGTAAMLLGAVETSPGGLPAAPPFPVSASAGNLLPALRADEERRRSIRRDPLTRAGDAYLVRGGRGLTVVAGYPWFTDWGRDTFISLRGLCLAAGRFEEAREILLPWSYTVSEGMIPNRFPDGGEPPEYNTVDAALWFVVAVHDYLSLRPRPADAAGLERYARDEGLLTATCEAILTGYAAGTRYGIRLDEADGLLFAGEPGVALTWMDARVDGRAITPRMGKPVEIQALWLNALYLTAANSPRWRLLYEKARVNFESRFWNAERGCLFDVVDVDGEHGRNDPSLRPNQLFAVGGLPLVLLKGPAARAVVDVAERALLTPLGLRTLAAGEPGYCPYYVGDGAQRDGAYHQGTVWPWLIGPFAEAWARVHGDDPAARTEARTRFVEPLVALLPESVGIGHLPEIADAEPPHATKGCPFQAWSLGELTRLALGVLR